MTNSTAERHANAGASDGSYLPDASEMDNTVTSDRTDPGPGQLVFVPDGDGGSWYLDSCPSAPTPDDYESTDRPLFSDANEPEIWESDSSTLRTHRQEVADQPDHSGVMVDESGNLGNDANAITHDNNHVINQYSSLSNTVDADNSGIFQTYPNTPKVDHQPVINHYFLQDASEVSNTTIEMESSQTSGSPLPNLSETDSPGHLTENTDQRGCLARRNIFISNHNVNDDILKGDSSKHKLDLLFRYGAIILGDKLCVTYRLSGAPVIIEGEVVPESTSTKFCVRIAPARTGFDGILRTIQGPKDLIVGTNKEYVARYEQALPQQWKEVRLTSSTGQDFGTLFEVRQAYQVWADEKAKWAARNSQATV